MEMLCALIIFWFDKCTTLKIQIVHSKWVPFIIYKPFLHKINGSKNKNNCNNN